MPTLRAGKPRASQQGYTYAAVLAAVVIVGIAAEVGRLSTSRLVQAERETELLFRGEAYMRAIGSYYRAHGAYPRTLADLANDPRAPGRQHLRAPYTDPMAKPGLVVEQGAGGWALIPAPDGGISGVASRSKARPMKRANFPQKFEAFDGAESYADWVFEFSPAGMAPRRGTPKPAS